MNSDIGKFDKFLYYGVWGVIFGLALNYGFHLFRGFTANILFKSSEELFITFNESSELLIVIFNITHAFLSAVIPALMVVFLIRVILKEGKVRYCIIPSITIIIWNNVDLIGNFESEYISSPFFYQQYIVNPLILVIIFVGCFWLVNFIKVPNKANQH